MTLFRSGRRASLTCSVSFLVLACAASGAEAQATGATNEPVRCQDGSIATAANPCPPAQLPATRPEAADTSGDVLVTGSRIKRPNYESLQPSVVIDSAQIESRGFETLGQAINEQPSFGVPGASPVGGQAGSFGSGQSFVNFLGLGDQRTLTLINGRRFVSSNTASIFGPTSAGSQVDLNAINTELVDRIETIAIGGAPIYGSDAIAGTVNIILKHDYHGFKIDGQYGITDQGDAPNYRIRGIAGMNFADGRGNVVISGEYNASKGLVYNDRALTALGSFYGDCPPGSQFNQCLYNNRRLPSISESGVLQVGDFVPLGPNQSEPVGLPHGTNLSVTDAQGRQLQFSPTGQLIPIDFGMAVGTPSQFNTDFSGGNGFNLFNTQQLLTDTKRYNANILAEFHITDNIRLFGEGWYAYSKGTNLREQPVYNSALFDAGGTPDGNVVLSVNNPFLTAAQRATIINSINTNPFSDQNQGAGPQDYFYLGRANTDLVSGIASTATTTYRFVAGLDGSFKGLGGRDWSWEIVGNYGHASTQGQEPTLVEQNFENAVGEITASNPNGIPCLAGLPNSPASSLNSTCTPLNLFGTGLSSQAARDYVTTIADPHGTNTQWVVTASLSGPLFKLPGGDLSFALGYEHRRESTAFNPGAFFFGGPDPDPTVDSDGDGVPDNERVQYGRSIPIFPVSGSFHTNEIFGELRAELVGANNNIPFVRSLELHGAARYVDHSTAGGDLTWTTEGRWGVTEDIAFRANFTHAIRAPAITEVFNPSSTFFDFATDPCDAGNRASGPNPTARQTNCVAALTAAGLSPAQIANFQSLSDQRSFHQSLVGNSALKNEKSNAWSIGVVLTPRFIPRLKISADWLDIKLRDAITSFSGTQVVDSCYDANSTANAFCPLIRRDSTGQLSFIQTRYFNAAEYRYKGLLAALDYTAPTPFLGAHSRIGINLSYQYLNSLTQKADASSVPAQLDGGIGYPHNSAVLNLNYANGPLELFTSFNYTGSVDQETNEPANFRQYEHINAVVFVNGGFSFNVTKKMSFHLDVDNIFNTPPPFPVPADGGSVSYFPGILGRFFRFGVSAGF